MSTLDFYNRNADDYVAQSLKIDISYQYPDFEACLPPGARILDLGCGGGRDSKHFMDQGFDVVSVDGSPAMCRCAEALLGRPVRCLLFSDLDYVGEFDGIWACATLLHVPKDEFDGVMRRVERALKPQGVLYASFKYGEGERTVDGRFFSYYSEQDLDSLSRLSLIQYWVSEDDRPDHAGEMWLRTLWRKP